MPDIRIQAGSSYESFDASNFEDPYFLTLQDTKVKGKRIRPVVKKILDHVNEKGAFTATGLLPESRAPPQSDLFRH